VQTGSESVCKAMNRPHRVEDFVKWVGRFRAAIPNITIATDIIVGYPGESKADFNKTLALIRKTKPDVVNLSKYTVRSGTKAAGMKQLPTEMIKERSRKASLLIKRITENRNRKYIGKTVEVLVLEGNGTKGRTANYKQVVLRKKAKLGSWAKARIKNVNHGSLFA
jgi:tRNA A37 methylthiotransferase MiaB